MSVSVRSWSLTLAGLWGMCDVHSENTSESTGHIISDASGITGCFQVNHWGLIRPQLVSSWLTTVVRRPSWGSFCCFCDDYKWLSSFSLLRYPDCWRLWPTNLHPTLTGKQLVLHLACWQSLTSPTYLESFLSSKHSSHGTVSSSSTTCLVVSDTRSISSCTVVAGMWLENFDCLWRSSTRSRFLAEVRMPAALWRNWLLSSSVKGNELLGGSALLCPLKSCADGFSDGLPFLEHSGHVMILMNLIYLALD